MAEHGLEDARFSVIVRPRHRFALLGRFGHGENQRLDRQLARLSEIEFVHRVEGVQAAGDWVLHASDLDAEGTECIVSARIGRTMLPDAAADARVKLGPGVGGLRVGQRRMPRAVGEMDDRQTATILQVPHEVGFGRVAQARPLPIAKIQHQQVVIENIVAAQARGPTPGPC